LGQKLTLNHPSLVDEGEETRVLVTAQKREREKRILNEIDYINSINHFIF